MPTNGKEFDFRKWYKEHARKFGLNSDPDAPEHFYDYRAAYEAGAEPDESGHWPSEFKRPGHPTYYLKFKKKRPSGKLERTLKNGK